MAVGLSVAVGMIAGTNAKAATTYTVTTVADSAGSCSGASCTTLRAAITVADGSAGNTIDLTGLSGTITLTSALPTITQSMVFLGPGASTLTISGNNAYQIFNISSGMATVSGLTLANGNTVYGGAIENSGALTVTNSTLSGNSANFGGAIYNASGILMVTNCTFSGNFNTDGGSGGAIFNLSGTPTVTNSTFSGNSSAHRGGAIDNNDGALTVAGSTFSGNSALYFGGAIDNDTGSSMTASNNIFVGNSAASNGGAGIHFFGGGMVELDYSLYYQNLDTDGTEDDCNSCTSNTNATTNSDPLLAALGSYGGTTTGTLLPEPGSPAICAGSTALIPSGLTTDQRGFGRTTTYNSSICVDLGAVQTNYTAAAFSSSSYSGVANQNLNPAPVVTVTENGQNVGGIPITLGYSGTGSPTGLGPVTTVGGTGATFSSLTASAAAQGTLSISLPITSSSNSVQPAALTASASLNIQLPTQTITFVTSSPVIYGYAPITLTATGGASGNPVTFSLDSTSTPGAATLNGSTLTIKGVGTAVIDANQAAGSGYAAAAQVQQSIIINPASLTITASSATVTYGSVAPTITPIFGTFFNGDTSAVLTKQPTCVTAYTTTSAVGSSPSTTCSGAAAVNYTFTYINGTVSVNPPPAFAISGGSSSLTITPGATTGNTVPITTTPSNGFTGTVNLSCSISPAAVSNPPTCSLSPASVTITGAGTQTSTLTISTTAATTAENHLKKLLWPSAGTALALVLMVGVPRRRRGWLTMLGVLVLSTAVGAIGCGGGVSGGSSGTTGTAAGTYTITVTGTSGNVTGTVGTIVLTVQ